MGNPDKKQEIIDKLETKSPETNEEAVQNIQKQTEDHTKEMETEKQTANEKKTMKMEELMNLLQDKPENAKDNAAMIVEQTKIRLQDSINRYINKIKELKNTNTEEVNKLKEEVKKEKDTYEKVKSDFFATSNYKFETFTKEDLGKIPTKIVRYATREGKLFNAPGVTKMKTLRRNHTIKTLIKKFNAIGKDPKN